MPFVKGSTICNEKRFKPGQSGNTLKSPGWVRAAVDLGLCGLRRGEVFGLAWGNVDLKTREVRIRQALKAPKNGAPSLGSVKTRSGRRTLPLPSWAIQSLIAHRDSLGAPPLPSLLVFMSTEGTPVRT